MALTALDVKLLGWSAAYVASQANIARLLGPAAPKLLATQTAMSARSYRAVLDSMDDAETARFRSHFAPDMVHPVIYAAALCTGAKRLGQLSELSPATRRALYAAPVVAAAADYVENVVDLHLLDHREAITDTRVRAISTVSITKWVLSIGALAYLSQGFVRVWVGMATGRRRGSGEASGRV
ncbi:hypothetical protein FK531_18830 [Rhodococcus spelaei]|uniref:Uncharacterized protein n=1 Tax=Rhodococcus spelaei TaxID=2546320 RepID=A0A541B0V1_9NOCA|nr:hypothetical protein [Rhodococcus spelaei]TQF65941.1 hypothetical protein FK531_18830 [Rhodococcus spelaei]